MLCSCHFRTFSSPISLYHFCAVPFQVRKSLRNVMLKSLNDILYSVESVRKALYGNSFKRNLILIPARNPKCTALREQRSRVSTKSDLTQFSSEYIRGAKQLGMSRDEDYEGGEGSPQMWTMCRISSWFGMLWSGNNSNILCSHFLYIFVVLRLVGWKINDIFLIGLVLSVNEASN